MKPKFEYPEVKTLVEKVQEFRIRFEPGMEIQDTPLEDLRPCRVWIEDKSFDVYLDNEYKDVEENNPAVLLQLLLFEIEGFEEAKNFPVWAKELGLDASLNPVHQLWLHWEETAPALRKLLGQKLKGISSYEFYLNSGATQELRSLDHRQLFSA